MTAQQPASPPQTPADLIRAYNQIKAWLTAESTRFDEYLKPHKLKLEEIKNQLLALANELNTDSFKTEFGTAYKSTIVTPKITDKEKFLDWVLENWDTVGDMLQIGAPQITAVETYMQDNNGQLPPFVATSAFTRINIRKS